MTRSTWALAIVALAAGAACANMNPEDPGPTAWDPSMSGGGGSGSPSGPGSSSPGAPSGLPCDVEAVLAKYCQACHASSPSGGAPNALVTYADLLAKSARDPSKTYAERSVTRMQASANIMPPGGPVVPASDVGVISAWIAAGYPMGSCGGGSGADGGGGGADGGDPYGTASVCTSGKTWSSGYNGGSWSMHPGRACIACHRTASDDAPTWMKYVGTVYPTAHEPDECYGSPGGLTVVVTDANGTDFPMPVDGDGNFYLASGSPVAPVHVKVVDGNGHSRAMASSPPQGDCNSCHTENGANGAPGRIMAP